MSKPIRPIKILHNQYEKLTDDIYYIGMNTMLRMNVLLGKKIHDGTRLYYHSEFMYESNKYIDINKLITIRRSFDFYLTIENIRENNGEKESIMIRIQDMIHIKYNLEKAYRWFVSKEFKDLFAFKENKLVILGKVDPVTITGLASNKTIILEPTVIEYENSCYEGIRMYLNSKSNYVDITIDNFMGLIYLFNTINLYESAQLLLNYHGRPEYGYNMVDFEGGYNRNKSIPKREIELKRNQKSFFDKLDDM